MQTPQSEKNYLILDLRNNFEIESQGKIEIDLLINSKAPKIIYKILDDLYKGVNFINFPENTRVICFCTLGLRA